MDKLYCYLNGEIILSDEAKISIDDIGLLRGYAIFDFLKSRNSKPLLLDEHLKRFRNSAKSMHLKIPLKDDEITKVIDTLIKKNNLPDSAIRLFLSGGPSADGMSYDVEKPTFFITIRPLSKHNPEHYQKGIKLITFEHSRHIPEVKSNNYLMMVNLKPIIKKNKAYDVLYTSNGKILEGSSFNLFIFKDNELITTKKDILLGTRRNFVLDLAKNRFRINEREISLDELKQATEAFITSTTREIMPVTKIDDITIGNGKVGANTKYLMQKMQESIK